MGRLLGFAPTAVKKGGGGGGGGGGGSSKGIAAKSVTLLEKKYLNTTPAGEYSNLENIDGFLNIISNPDAFDQNDTDVQSKIAELGNKKLQYAAKASTLLSQQSIFDSNLRESVAATAKQNFADLKKGGDLSTLARSYAAVYGDAADAYDEFLNDQISKYGTSDKIDQGVIDYRDELRAKADKYNVIMNAYNTPDPVTGKIGALNANAYGVTVDTNPADGSIVGMDIIESGKVDSKEYMRTSVPIKGMSNANSTAIPMYLRTYETGQTTSDGKPIVGAQIGNMKFQATTQDTNDDGFQANVLTIPKRNAGGFLGLGQDEAILKENENIEKLHTEGLDLNTTGADGQSAFKYQPDNIPNGTIIQEGSKLFYSSDRPGELLEITGKDPTEKQNNLQMYLRGIGKDPSTIKTYGVSKSYLSNPDGTSKVKSKVDANYFNPPAPSTSTPQAFATPGQGSAAPTEQPDAAPSFFAGKTPATTPAAPQMSPGQAQQNNPLFNKPSAAVNKKTTQMPAQESTNGKVSIGDVIEKGKSFFRNFTK